MPTIERYTKGIVKDRAVADLVNPQAINTAGSGFRAAAGVLSTGAGVVDKFVEAQETTAVNEAIIKNKKQKMEFLEAKRQENISNPVDFHKRIEPELQKIDADMEAALPTGRAKAAFKERMAQVNLAAYEDNFQWARSRQVEMFAESVESSALDLGNMAVIRGRNGQNIDDLVNDALATTVAGSTFVAPEKISSMKRSILSGIQRNYALGLMQADPSKAQSFLENIDASSEISPGDRSNLIATVENMKEAKQRKAGAAQTKADAEARISQSMFMQRAFSGNEDPESLILEIRKAEAEGFFDGKKSLAADLVKVINAQTKVNKIPKASEEEKDDFYQIVMDKLSVYENESDTLTPGLIGAYDDMETTIYDGIQKGLITSEKASSLLEKPRAYISQQIKDGNVEKTWGSYFPGVQDPIAHTLPKIRETAKTPRAQRQLLSKFSDLLGKVDEKGNIIPDGQYQSSGNAAVDQQIINRALKKAVELTNEELAPAAAAAKANAVVGVVGGTYATFQEAEADAKAKKFPDGTMLYVNGKAYKWTN